ncbi:MAG: hypothetical protein RJB62_692 [Pseudomonadota bacterium]|jgi:DNA-nicking Smr family endonuclease
MKSGKKDISESDAALFREVLKDARPLDSKPLHREPLKPRSRNAPINPFPAATPPPKPPVFTQAHTSEIGGHREAHFRKGRLEPEARIDLHGYTQDAAYRALHRFVLRARSLDQRLVLVITGKAGVLHNMLPRWLGESDFRELVVGASAAHIKHGGTGAYYVALKRAREK